MSLPEVCPGALEGFPGKPTGLLILAKVEQDGGQIAFGRQGTWMIRAGVPDAAFQDLAQNRAGLLEMTLFEHDFPEGTEYIHPHRMFACEGGRQVIEGLVQQTNGSVDITGTPEGNGQFVDHRESLRIVGP